MTPLNILHVFRAPVGGLFRHVADLAREQATRGHRVGLIADITTGGERAEAAFAALAPSLALGISRIPMTRNIGLGDIGAVRHVTRRARETNADVLHGHGAKGGAYARLTFGHDRAVRAYTPHGGSLLFPADSLAGQIYLKTEKLLMLRGDLFMFESQFSAEVFRHKVGTPRGLVRVSHNGVSRAEFEPIVPVPEATDLVFMGELRPIKGIDVLIAAIAKLHGQGRKVTATLVGSGPSEQALKAQVGGLGLADAIRFRSAMPARQALALGRIMTVPSRAESLPYVVLEAAAGGVPLITTDVGGIAEIYGPQASALIPADDVNALATAIVTMLDAGDARAAFAATLRDRVATSFSVDAMVDGILKAYGEALDVLAASARR
ncbi:MAG: glycosyltransferase [Rhodopseudomonas sp.]|nr:glycosyltransferase [Rhodopseudomonas sp.]